MSVGDFDILARRGIDEGNFAGAVLRVERHGVALFEGAWGEALHRGDASVPMSLASVFDLASLTKLFTTTAVLRLVTAGELRLDTRVAELLESHPDTLCPDGALRSRLVASLAGIDMAALLSHSSGLHYWYPFYTRLGDRFEAILADLLEAHPPSGETIYSDLNFMILGRLVEAVTGTPLARAVEELVLEPLGLLHSSWSPPHGPPVATEFGNRIEERMVADLGLSFEGWRDPTRPLVGEPDDGNCHYFFGGVAGHAGIFSDARDLCRLGRFWLEGGRLGEASWIEAALAEAALRDRGKGRGFGFQLGDLYPGEGAGHTGFTGTYLHVNEGRSLVICLLANRLHVASPRDLNPLRKAISERALSMYS